MEWWKRNKSTFSVLLHPSVPLYIPSLNLVPKLTSKAFFSPHYCMLLVHNTLLLLTLLLRPVFKDSPFLPLSTSQTISTSQLKTYFFSLCICLSKLLFSFTTPCSVSLHHFECSKKLQFS